MLVEGGASEGERIKVLDFGLAYMDEGEAERERLTQSGVIFGTLQYMSPEHCRGRGIGPHSDIYSVGVMLYEMLSGELPFDSRSPAELMTQHLFVSPPPIETKAKGREISPELHELALWALAKQPEKRPTAAQLRDVLRQAAQQSDAGSVARRLHKERILAMGLSREERALGTSGAVPAVSDTEAGASPEGSLRRVALWGLSDARGSEIEGALGANRLAALRWPEPLAERTAGAESVRAVVLGHGPRAVGLLTALRRDPQDAGLPVLVVDVPREAMPALIGAGASDIALVGSEPGDLCRKVQRMISRGR